MNKFPFTLCQIYALAVLLAATVLSALPYSVLALVLLLAMLFIIWRPLPPGFKLAITTMAVFLLPLALSPILHYLTYTTLLSLTGAQVVVAMSTLPVIYLLDYRLRQNAENIKALAGRRKGRFTTYTYLALFVATVVMLLVSLALNNPVLLFTGLLVALYLLTVLIVVLFTFPRLPIDVPATWKRIIAGTTADISLGIKSKASIRINCLLSPVDPWVKVTPQRFKLGRAGTELNLTVTPPLAGPSHLQLQVSATDSRGLIQVNQLIEPVELHVIPRAKYAEWLAMKYLEQAGPGTSTASRLPPKAILLPKRGVEYFDSRTYQPGDQLRNIDWKHTLKLGELIIKEYTEAGEQAAIIAANLSVTDAEEADKLAFNLITTALTLARDAIPTALAAYDQQRVVLTTPVTDPRETLKRTLSLVKDITFVEFAHRYLQPADLGKLRRNITLLKSATSEPAQRLLALLSFEYQAIDKAAENHPATLALSLATKHAPVPSTIVLITQWNHDAEALRVTTEKLSRREFTTMPIETK